MKCLMQRLACPDKCVLSKKNLLNDNGMPSKVKMMKLFEGISKAQNAVRSCAERVMKANDRKMGE